MFENLMLNVKDLFYLGTIAFSFWLAYKQGKNGERERSKLLDRIMARNYQEYEYYKEMFKGEVKELKDQRDDAKVEKKEEDELKEATDVEYKREKDFLDKTEEDWTEDEVDLEELRDRIEK